MAEESDQERTEAPSSRRLEKAREGGQAPQSRELSTFVVLMAGASLIWMTGGGMVGSLAGMIKSSMVFDASLGAGTNTLFTQIADELYRVMLGFAPLILAIVVVVILTPILFRGWLFSAKPLVPNFSRINPASGLKRIFSMDGLTELFKSIAKVALLGVIGFWFTWSNRQSVFSMISEPSLPSFHHLGYLLGKGFLLMVGAMAAIVLVDAPYQLWSHYRKLRMSREELKQEAKESEGDPHIRARIRSLQREAARRRMMAEIPNADVVVTNPTHYAVALKYKEGDMRAPRVVAMGADLIAAKIRGEADLHHVPILEAPPLARALYHHTKLGAEIPAALYAAVAEVLAYVYQLKRYSSHGGARPVIPSELPIPMDLDPLQAAS
jgi:flagellar biosynthetic protein FlhB